MNLNSTQFEDLLAEGVPVHVAARIVEERKAGAYKDWNDFLIRLFYNGTPQAGRSPDVRPADQALLRHVKGFFLPVAATGSEGPTSSPTQNDGKGGSGSSVGIGAGGSVEANAAMPMRKGPWWEWQEQGACPTSSTEGSADDAFPAGKSQAAGHTLSSCITNLMPMPCRVPVAALFRGGGSQSGLRQGCRLHPPDEELVPLRSD